MFVCLFVEGAERGLSRAVGRPTPRGVYPELGSRGRRKGGNSGRGRPALWLYGAVCRFSVFGFPSLSFV